jgi:hypothetical protein
VTDLGPNKKKIAQLFRMLGSSGGERENAWRALVRVMQNERVSWTDIGDVIAGGEHDDGKYTEAEMQEVAQAARAEGVEAGIRIGKAHVSNGSGNGQLTLPKPCEMAEYCHDRLAQLKSDKERDFVIDTYTFTRRRARLSSGRLSWLTGIYIKISGTTG